MRYLFVVLLLILGLGCVPAKPLEVYQVVQSPVNPYLSNMTQTPVYTQPATLETANTTIYDPNPPSPPNPYLNKVAPPAFDSYFKPIHPSVPQTYWTPIYQQSGQ
jgi:hypothetical protein